jgi:hypothetical protein
MMALLLLCIVLIAWLRWIKPSPTSARRGIGASSVHVCT